MTSIKKQMSVSNSVTGILEKSRKADGSSNPSPFPALTQWSCYDNRNNSHLGGIDS